MDNIKARLDRLVEQFAYDELWDGTTMEDIARHCFGENEVDLSNVPPGVMRAVAFVELSSAAREYASSKRSGCPGDRETIAGIGLDGLSPKQARQRLLELGEELGFYPAELSKLTEVVDVAFHQYGEEPDESDVPPHPA